MAEQAPWDEYGKYLQGSLSGSHYEDLLDDAATAAERNADRPKVIKSSQMPWENAHRQRGHEHARRNR
jgi:hypothetical protein